MADNSQTRAARRKQKKTKKKPLWKKILLTLFITCLVIGIGVGALVTFWIVTAPGLDEAKLTDSFSSTVYDQDGEPVVNLGDEKRKKITYDDIPDVLVDAVTATEDSRFFKHSGIDMRRIGGAVVANFKRGFGAEGASTITQQVVEKSFLTPEKQLKLKVQEAWLSLKLERKYSKEEILEMYLNKIYYGSGAYGAAKAAEVYFGKDDLNDLTLPEAAILAGLPQRPSAYNPFENPELMEKRMNTVLTLMVRHGKISQDDADEAKSVDVASLLTDEQPNSSQYESFVQQVEKEVSEKLDGANIYTDGLKIYTTLDPSIQDHVEFLLKDSDENPIPYPDDEMQAGMVVLDTKNGAIRAVGGRRNSKGIRETNNAINSTFQLGSNAKPIMAYGPAIEYNKMSTYQQINDDKPYEIAGTGGKAVRNWNRQYAGWMSARYALSQSLNVPAVKIMEEVGNANTKKFAEGLGINFYEDKVSITDAIGGTETQVSPLQMAGAYRAFGNEGIYNDPYAVTKVEFPDGRTIDLKPEPKEAMSDYTAYMITDMLKTAISEGTGQLADIPGLDVAGKTGTTNLVDVEGSPDSWFSGYTTNYTISVWTGHEGKRRPLKDTKIPHALFKNTMTEISKDIETPDFKKPDSVVEVGVEKGSNPAALPSDNTPSSQIVKELFVKGNEPKKASEKFEALDPVKGLQAKYDENANSIKVSWDYSSDDDVSFEISASVDGGEMKALSSTEDTSMEISDVDEGSEYNIQVVAVSGSDKSDPKSTKVKVPGDDDDEDEEEIPSVSGLSANYKEDASLIDVSWNYDGPTASFEIDVNGQKQSTDSNGIEISGVSPGETYTINVTPIGKEDGAKGGSQSTSVTIPDDETEDSDGDNDDGDSGEDPGDDSGGDSGGDEDSDQEPEPDPEPDNDQDDQPDEGQDENQDEDQSGDQDNDQDKQPDDDAADDTE